MEEKHLAGFFCFSVLLLVTQSTILSCDFALLRRLQKKAILYLSFWEEQLCDHQASVGANLLKRQFYFFLVNTL